MPKVQINETNERHCRCPQCPVELASQCSVKKIEEMKENPEQDPDTKDMPELYCGIGKAGCSDMDAKYGCLCPSCLVWDENDLSNNHYCVKGDAEKLG